MPYSLIPEQRQEDTAVDELANIQRNNCADLLVNGD